MSNSKNLWQYYEDVFNIPASTTRQEVQDETRVISPEYPDSETLGILISAASHESQYQLLHDITSIAKRGGSARFKKYLKLQNVEYTYWNDIGELIDSLKFLKAEKEAGNDNVENEVKIQKMN